jgi:hypothetical protein
MSFFNVFVNIFCIDLADIVESAVKVAIAPLRSMLVEISAPRKTSTASERVYHTKTFKQELTSRIVQNAWF